MTDAVNQRWLGIAMIPDARGMISTVSGTSNRSSTKGYDGHSRRHLQVSAGDLAIRT